MTKPGFAVKGYITKPSATKASRSFQNFFINRRFVKTRTAMVALEEAFKGSAMVGKYPGCVLNIEIPPETVDVNVHPAKMEVRFSSEKEVFDLVYYGVKTALSTKDMSAVLEESKKVNKDFWNRVASGDKAVKEHFEEVVQQTTLPPQPAFSFAHASWNKEKADVKYDVVDYMEDEIRNKDELTPYKISGDITHTVQYKIRRAVDEAIETGTELPEEYKDGVDVIKQEGIPAPEIPRDVDGDELPFGKLKYVGELFKTYILLESVDEIIFIDKHAAHERILYEKLKSGVKAFDCQYLISPITCNLSDEQCEAIVENAAEMEKFGFIVEGFGRGSVITRSLPFWIKPKDAENIIGEIADSFVACKRDVTPEKLDHLYANIACRAAIKANDTNSEFELEKIVSTLLNDPKIKYCPHGRPVSVSLTKNKLERMFGRQQ